MTNSIGLQPAVISPGVDLGAAIPKPEGGLPFSGSYSGSSAGGAIAVLNSDDELLLEIPDAEYLETAGGEELLEF